METVETRQAIIVDNGKVELRKNVLTMSDDQILVKNEACGLCSFEILLLTGKIGEFPMPFGHEPAGRVVAVGKNITKFKEGDRISGAWGPSFADYSVTDLRNVVLIPEGVPSELALTEPLACTNIARTAAVELGDYAMVVGCGSMGLFAISALSRSGAAELIAVDTLDSKLKLAKDLGATQTINSSRENVAERIKDITAEHGVDMAIEITGRPEALDIASDAMRKTRGRLLLASSHGGPQTCDMRLWERGTIVYNSHPTISLDISDEFRRAVLALKNGIFPMQKLVTHRFAFEDMQEAVNALMGKSEDYIKGVVII